VQYLLPEVFVIRCYLSIAYNVRLDSTPNLGKRVTPADELSCVQHEFHNAHVNSACIWATAPLNAVSFLMAASILRYACKTVL
jgi:hypothetical protein